MSPGRDEAGEREDFEGLSDRDALAILMMGGMSGFSGFTPQLYASLTDQQILDLVFAERDDDGVITEARLRRRGGLGEGDGNVKDAARELPSAESLQIPDEVFRWGFPGTGKGVPVAYILMFWQVFRSRGWETERILTKWREQSEAHGQQLLGLNQKQR